MVLQTRKNDDERKSFAVVFLELSENSIKLLFNSNNYFKIILKCLTNAIEYDRILLGGAKNELRKHHIGNVGKNTDARKRVRHD